MNDREYPLLNNKLLPPALPGAHVFRDRLVDDLSTAVARSSLTLVSAPAGSGKTVLASSWVAAKAVSWPIAWLRLGDADNHPETFWTYFVEALSRHGIALPHVRYLAGREAADPSNLAWLAADLIEAPEPVVVVLDDAERLTNPTVLAGLDFVLRHAAPVLRVVMCTRTDPALPLHRYRLAESIAEVRMDAMAFTDHEAEQLLKGHGVPVTTELATALTGRTGGWAAGLRLAALVLEHTADTEGMLSSLEGADAMTAEYLMTEVVDVQRPDVRRALLRTSVASQLWPDLVDELTGARGGAQMLAAFDRANVLLDAANSPAGSRQLRPPLRDALRAQLAYESPELIVELNRRCASWLAADGQWPAAVAHAVGVGDHAHALSVLIDGLAIGALVVPSGDAIDRTVLETLAAGPGASAALVQAALSLGRDDLSISRRHLARVAELRDHVDETIQFRLSAAVVQAVLCADVGDLDGAIQACDEASLLLAQLPPGLSAAHPELRALLLTTRGTALLWQGAVEPAEQTLSEALAASGASRARYLHRQCLGRLALLYAMRGQLGRAEKFGLEAEQLADETAVGVDRRPDAAAVALAWIYAQQYRGDHARHWLARAAESSFAREHSVLAPLLTVVRARLESRADGVLASFATASGSVPWVGECLAVQSAALNLARCRPELAREALAGLPEPHPPRIEVAIKYIDALNACSPLDSANQLRDAGVALDLQVEARLAQGLIHLDERQDAAAVVAIEQALRLAEPEQLRRPFIESAPRIREILRIAHAGNNAGDWLQPRRPTAPSRPQFAVPRPVTRDPIAGSGRLGVQEELSARELEVLGHLAELLSNQDIGATMFLSVNTVRTHVRNILRKLDVSRRNEAVRRAWELNLI